MTTKHKGGRPPKSPPEKMFFGIKCTEEESRKIWEMINREGLNKGKRIFVSDFFLRHVGVRHNQHG